MGKEDEGVGKARQDETRSGQGKASGTSMFIITVCCCFYPFCRRNDDSDDDVHSLRLPNHSRGDSSCGRICRDSGTDRGEGRDCPDQTVDEEKISGAGGRNKWLRLLRLWHFFTLEEL